MPKTGSAYVYTYVTIGEFMAFIIGWNLILEYIIGTSSVARAFSTYFDSLIDNRMQTFFREYFPMSISFLSPYPDLFAAGITILITRKFTTTILSSNSIAVLLNSFFNIVVLSLGAKESSRLNNLFTSVNLCVVSFIIIYGALFINFDNWHIKPELVSSTLLQYKPL